MCAELGQGKGNEWVGPREKEEKGKGVGVGLRKELAWTGHWPEEDEKRREEGEGCWALVYMGC